MYFCHFPDFSASECVYGTGNYAFWEVANLNLDTQPRLIRTFEKASFSNLDARDVNYQPDSRGSKYFVTVVTRKDFIVEILAGMAQPIYNLASGLSFEIPGLHNMGWLNDAINDGIEGLIESQDDSDYSAFNADIPLCDAIKVNVQSAPTLSSKSLTPNTGSNPIVAEVNYTYDEQYSYAAINNQPAQFTWTFHNTSYPDGGTYTQVTNEPIVYFYPEYSGLFDVNVTINDGRFSSSKSVGSVRHFGITRTCSGLNCGNLN